MERLARSQHNFITLVVVYRIHSCQVVRSLSFLLLGIVASTAGDLVVDLTVGELVDLVVVLVAHAGLVGQVVDLCEVVVSAIALHETTSMAMTYECEPGRKRPSRRLIAVRRQCCRCRRSCPWHPSLCSKGWTYLWCLWMKFVCLGVVRIGWREIKLRGGEWR